MTLDYDFDRLLENVFALPLNRTQEDSSVTSDSKGVTLTMLLPGVLKEDVKIEVAGRVLTVEATSKVQSRLVNKSVKRSWTLSQEVNADSVSAKLENGILTVNIPAWAAKKSVSITVS